MDTLEATQFPDTGKIQNSFFKERIFPFCGAARREVMIGPEYGVDISLVSLPNGLAMAMTSDPLSLIPTLGLRESAWLSVQLMANDMATTGFAPQYAQFTLNLPTTLEVDDFEQYWRYIHEFCARLGIAITGGHTGRFEGLQSTVVGGGTMITLAPGEQIITSKGARPGDILIMTKQCALIATSILALSFPETVKKGCGAAVQQQAASLFYETSAVEAGLIAGEIHRHTFAVTAMHDVTEGGVLGAIIELAHASGCGVEVNGDNIPVGHAQQLIGKLFNIDPRFCVGAGSMIITVKPEILEPLLKKFASQKIQATVIGKITEPANGLILSEDGTQKMLQHPGADPYWNAFFQALQLGWK
ncbi:MAG TPA: AIR synthase family protein [Ohtaekwangia sp.]|uniref:AIR synthase family protein n=1 Tax=Ohtaekwangia sp. TaxID=2066019 RepID=UPI002F95AEB6